MCRVKILKLEAVPLVLHMKEPFSTTNVLLNDLYFVVVRVETDAGIVGYGEALPAWEVDGETQASVRGCVELCQNSRQIYKDDLLIGKSIATVDDIRAVMDRLHPVDRPATIAGNSAAKAAIEQALLDACSRFQKVPLHRLLDIEPSGVKSSFTSGIRPVDETLAWVDAVLKFRPHLILLKVGSQSEKVGNHASLDRDIEVVTRTREKISQSGQEVLLAADANEGYRTAARALDFCRPVEGLLDWLEQPVLAEDRLAFREIRRQVEVPLMADESLQSYGDAKMLLQLGGVDYFNVKLMKSGGFFTALKVIDLAAEYGVKCHIGSMMETSLGCLMGCCTAMARPDNVITTDMIAWKYIADEPWQILREADGKIVLKDPAAIGTGVSDGVLRSLAAAPRGIT
jgi:L-alanine-DL-glutamate epimerase-like enolase superfamily enzyme